MSLLSTELENIITTPALCAEDPVFIVEPKEHIVANLISLRVVATDHLSTWP